MSNDAAKDSSFLPVCGFTLSGDQEVRRVLLPSLLHFSEVAPKHAKQAPRDVTKGTESQNRGCKRDGGFTEDLLELDFFFSVVVVVVVD